MFTMVHYSIFACYVLLAIAPCCIQASQYVNQLDTNCKRDFVIVLDVSKSIGPGLFNDSVRTFLEDLVKSDNLDFGEDGSQIALIVFSSKDNTQIWRSFPSTSGERLENRQEMLDYIRKLDYNKLNKGLQDKTYTGKALELAYQSLGGRRSVPDVVILFTDGAPNPRTKDDNQTQIALKYAKEMKRKSVRIVVIGVDNGKKTRKTLRFRKVMKVLATAGDYIPSTFAELKKGVIESLVNHSCSVKPGQCTCSHVGVRAEYVSSPEMKAKIWWKAPGLNCGGGVQTALLRQSPPQLTSPHEFRVGNHRITYTFKYGWNEVSCDVDIEVKVLDCQCMAADVEPHYIPTGMKTQLEWTAPRLLCHGKEVSAAAKQSPPFKKTHKFGVGKHSITYSWEIKGSTKTCPIDIEVKECRCPAEKIHVTPLIKAGESTVSYTWDVPKPNCPGFKGGYEDRESDEFSYGDHSKEYSYDIGGYSLTCAVKFVVRGVPCSGKDYNPDKEVCCCDKVYTFKANHVCCGGNYINSATKKCCPNSNVVERNRRCLGE